MSLLRLVLILSFSYFLNSQTYDYLLLVQEVAGTVCQQKSCLSEYALNLPKTGINMHGLWPNYQNGSYPQFCGSLAKDAYSDSKISSSVLSDLNANWVGLFSSTSSFRNHEWEKHGSCFIVDAPSRQKTFLTTPNSVDQQMNEFFSTVMQVKKSIGLESIIFNSEQNEAQNGVQWQSSDLFSTLEQALGVSVFNYDCDGNNNLYTITICVDASSYQPINCPSTSGFKYNCWSDTPINVPYFNPQ